jgi:hypothetical protein
LSLGAGASPAPKTLKGASGQLSHFSTRHLFGCKTLSFGANSDAIDTKTKRFSLENLLVYRNVELTGGSKRGAIF